VRCLLTWFCFFQAEDGIRDFHVTGVQTCALPILVSSCLPSTPSSVLRPKSAKLSTAPPVLPKVVSRLPLLGVLSPGFVPGPLPRSEERRVGKARRRRGRREHHGKQSPCEHVSGRV